MGAGYGNVKLFGRQNVAQLTRRRQKTLPLVWGARARNASMTSTFGGIRPVRKRMDIPDGPCSFIPVNLSSGDCDF